ncbi:unnamed protein product [Linum tenue]|uniref:Uncharacterized protein n=1 Tax=Linum tenue TaxID=586396 RepID=A0AAV0P4Q6_9ROSI|nr:unnamed protein product [Linum tenue]
MTHCLSSSTPDLSRLLWRGRNQGLWAQMSCVSRMSGPSAAPLVLVVYRPYSSWPICIGVINGYAVNGFNH